MIICLHGRFPNFRYQISPKMGYFLYCSVLKLCLAIHAKIIPMQIASSLKHGFVYIICMGNLHDCWSKKNIVTNFYEVNHYICSMLLGFCFMEEDVFASVVSCLYFKSLRFWIWWNFSKHMVLLLPILFVHKLTRQ